MPAADTDGVETWPVCGDSAPAPRPQVVHVSADFPDPVVPDKTPVIRSLLELSGERFAHRVYSLNRRVPRPGDLLGKARPAAQAFTHGAALIYRAWPFGLLHARELTRLGDWLAEQLAQAPPALLVGHKLSVEGLIVARAAARLQRPYAVSLQGNTDTKVLAARPDLVPRLARVFHEAAMVFPFAPWALAAVERRLGPRQGPVELLPCPTDLDQPMAPQPCGDGLVSVFHLRHHRLKNLQGMVKAMRLLRRHDHAARLDIVGGGDAASMARCRAIAGEQSGISFAGPLDRKALRQRLNRATGLVLPSLRESFGLVFVEALFAGLPVIYPRGAAIDGWLDGMPFAIPVDPHDPREIAAAIRHLQAEEAGLKAALRGWQRSAAAARFQRPAIAATFGKGLEQAIAPRNLPVAGLAHAGPGGIRAAGARWPC